MRTAQAPSESSCTIYGRQACGADGRWRRCEGACTYVFSWSANAQCCRRSSRYEYKSEFDYSTNSWVNRSVRIEFNENYSCSVFCNKSVELKGDPHTDIVAYRETNRSCQPPTNTCL
jgi:hypothetical protein